METVHGVYVSDVFQKHVVELIHRTRRHPALEIGCSPRGVIALTKAARARAFLFGRDYVVPEDLFDPDLFQQTVNDNLGTKPGAQQSYQASYALWMQPILNDPATLERYYRYYYQLHKNVEEQMMVVLQTLLASRYRDDTIVIFTSDHGDLLGSHAGMHQKWYTAYEEAIRQAAREIGRKFLDRRDIAQAWPYFRMLGEPEPVRQALANYQPGPEEDPYPMIEIAWQQGVHPEKGFDLVLDRNGVCSAITMVHSSDLSQNESLRSYCVRRLVRVLHEQLVDALSRAT